MNTTRRPATLALALVGLTAAMPALMLAVDRGLVPPFSLAEPVWWLLPVLSVGYWVAWVRWARAGGESASASESE